MLRVWLFVFLSLSGVCCRSGTTEGLSHGEVQPVKTAVEESTFDTARPKRELVEKAAVVALDWALRWSRHLACPGRFDGYKSDLDDELFWQRRYKALKGKKVQAYLLRDSGDKTKILLPEIGIETQVSILIDGSWQVSEPERICKQYDKSELGPPVQLTITEPIESPYESTRSAALSEAVLKETVKEVCSLAVGEKNARRKITMPRIRAGEPSTFVLIEGTEKRMNDDGQLILWLGFHYYSDSKWSIGRIKHIVEDQSGSFFTELIKRNKATEIFITCDDAKK